MANFADKLVDPMIAETYGEEVVRMRENMFSRALSMASQMSQTLIHQSSSPGAIADITVPTPAKRKLDGNYGPVRDGRGRQLANAIGLDGETFKYVIGSVVSASSSVGAAAVQYVRTDGKDNMIHNVKVIAGTAASIASAAASGTGAVLNFAGSKMMANMTQEDYHELEAETQRVLHAQQTSAVVSQMHEQAYQVQENRRLAGDAANKRIAEEAMAKAQQQELDFQDARSVASASVRAKHGAGRRGNVTRSLQGRQPARERMVRNEPEGIGKQLVKGVGRGMTKMWDFAFPAQPGRFG